MSDTIPVVIAGNVRLKEGELNGNSKGITLTLWSKHPTCRRPSRQPLLTAVTDAAGRFEFTSNEVTSAVSGLYVSCDDGRFVSNVQFVKLGRSVDGVRRPVSVPITVPVAPVPVQAAVMAGPAVEKAKE